MKVAGSPYATQALAMGPAGRPGAPGGPGDTAAMGAIPDQPQAGVAVGLAEPPPYPGSADELGGPAPGPRPPRGGRRSGGKGKGMKIVAMAAGAAVVVGGGAVAALALTGGGGDDGKATVSASPQADAAKPPPVDPYVEQQQRRKLAYERATRAARQSPGKKPALMPKGEPIPTKKPETETGGVPSLGSPVPKGVAQAYAKSIMDDPGTQFGCLQKLWDKESNWNYRAANPSSGAYGIPQALPGSKMSSAGADWKTNYKTQIRWGLGYIDDRYGTPCKAWSHSQSVGWY
ncbi:lytic transglycosylase domain-containing protein [Actinomadura rugatobispora]|uniref:Lytic transglycosylase domain-containing protein n=1 Tax=Actinomadura rugatobispora TaxID=1994 RepID=A0ABW1AB33_9ACTN